MVDVERGNLFADPGRWSTASRQAVNKKRFIQFFNDGQIPPVEGLLQVPCARVTLHDVLADGDVVNGFVTATWPHDGGGPGEAPPGTIVHFQGAFAYRFGDGPAPVGGLQMWDEGPLFAQRRETLSPTTTPLYFGSDFGRVCREFGQFWDFGDEPHWQDAFRRRHAPLGQPPEAVQAAIPIRHEALRRPPRERRPQRVRVRLPRPIAPAELAEVAAKRRGTAPGGRPAALALAALLRAQRVKALDAYRSAESGGAESHGYASRQDYDI